MSDQILNSDLAKMPAKGESIFGSRRWRLSVLLSEFTIIGAGVAFLFWPVFHVSDVSYAGPAEWEAEVRSLVTLPSDGNLLHFVPADAETRIESVFSERGDAQVRIELPGRISIRMNPYEPRLWGDGQIGIGCDGSLLTEPASYPDLPRWNPGIEWEGSTPLAERAKSAAGAWEELALADSRYALITSEWTCDPEYGWMTTAVDGKTRIAFGKTMVEERARSVAHLLTQGDTLLATPCMIDARFDGQLLLSKIPEVVKDTTKVDSTAAAPVASEVPVTSKDLKQPKTAKGRA